MCQDQYIIPLLYTVIVCDRYSAYKRLVRLLGGLVILAFCWAHVRRDFVECLAGQVELTQWCQGWIELIASLYRLNDERLEHYDPGVQRQTPAFDAAQGALEEALDGLFAQAARELAGLVERVLPAHPLVQAVPIRLMQTHTTCRMLSLAILRTQSTPRSVRRRKMCAAKLISDGLWVEWRQRAV